VTAENSKNAPPSAARIVDTIEAAAGATGYSETFLAAVKSQGCPAFRNGRVHLEELEAYYAANQETMERLEAECDEMDDVDVNLKREKLRRIKQANDITAGLYLLKTSAAAQVETLASELKNTLRRRLEDELPRELVGKTEAEIRAATTAVVDELCDHFSNHTEWTK
jgi:hypothetical protein